jgi:hypothetical protein
MWGPGAYDRYQASQNPTQGIAPTQNPTGGGNDDAFMTAFIQYLMNQQQNTPTYNRQSTAPRSDTQIRMGM